MESLKFSAFVDPDVRKKIIFFCFLKINWKSRKKNSMGIDLPQNVICMQSFKFMAFVDPKKSR